MWHKAVWQRIAVIASVVWLGGVMIYSATARNFDWFDYRGQFGPATITAFIGIAVIFAVSLGMPWIAQAAGKPVGPAPSWGPKLGYKVSLITPSGTRLVPFDDVMHFTRHRAEGDLTVATLYLTNGERLTGQANEGVLQLLSKKLTERTGATH